MYFSVRAAVFGKWFGTCLAGSVSGGVAAWKNWSLVCFEIIAVAVFVET